jgi:hypothetical protein
LPIADVMPGILPDQRDKRVAVRKSFAIASSMQWRSAAFKR